MNPFRILLPILALLCPLAYGGEYKKITHAGTTYHAYIASPDELEIHWKTGDGTPYRHLGTLSAELRQAGRDVHFIGNAGIFMEDSMPLGLHIEGGRELRKANKVKNAYGNFYLQPNGIFFIEGNEAAVVTTDAYLAKKHTPRIATQSGPMLLIDGRVHPKFQPESKNIYYRNGVGILPDGKVLFMITDPALFNAVNLHNFASAFAAQGCKNALFLDGGLSAVHIPAAKVRVETASSLGPMFSVSTPN